jgi:hypothetical protein
MSKAVSTLRGMAFGAAVAAALTFGAASAAAGDRSPRCTDPFATGSCSTDAGCRTFCYGLGNSYGVCNEGTSCCYCVDL